MIPHAIAVATGKGGSGKTSIAANLAAIAAKAGWTVLAVDLDPQGNLGLDLGYLADPRYDGGRSLFAAVAAGTAPDPIRAVRDRLDVIAAGPHHTVALADTIQSARLRNPGAVNPIGPALETLADNYDLIVLDTPPSNGHALAAAALEIAHYVVAPVTSDPAGLVALQVLAGEVTAARHTNPELEFLAAVAFRIASSARHIRAELERAVNEVLPGALLTRMIRTSELTAQQTRAGGEVAHEYAAGAGVDVGALFQALRRGETPPVRKSTAAAGVADDYIAVVRELLDRYTARQTEWDTEGVGE
jgi:chromosome partitioning protein